MNRRPCRNLIYKSAVFCFCIFCALIIIDNAAGSRITRFERNGKHERRKKETCLGKPSDKVAVVFYGLPRGLSHTHRSINENVLNVLRARCVPFEIFFHRVVFLEPFSNPRNNEINVVLNNSEWRLLNPDVELSTEHGEFLSSHEHFINSVLAYGDPHHNEGLSTRNELEALHSLKQAVRAAMSEGKHRFNGLIILRPDLIYHDEFDVDLLLHAVSNRLVVIPAWQSWSGANDRFSFGAWGPTVELGMRFDKILQYCQSTNSSWHAETYVDWLLNDMLIRTGGAREKGNEVFCHTAIRASRVRANGVIKDEDFSYPEEKFLSCYS